jgi:hypothetical protein
MVDGDAAKVEMMEKIGAACTAITDADRCEFGFKTGGCIKLGTMGKKIDIGF